MIEKIKVLVKNNLGASLSSTWKETNRLQKVVYYEIPS